MHGHHFQKELLHDLSTDWQEANQPAVPPSTSGHSKCQSSGISSDVFSENNITTTLTNFNSNGLFFFYTYTIIYQIFVVIVYRLTVRDLHTIFFDQTIYTSLQGFLYVNHEMSTSTTTTKKHNTIFHSTVVSLMLF